MSASNDKQEKPEKNDEPKPLPPPPPTPPGFRMGVSKPVECSIPAKLAIVLSEKAFTQLFSYAYATTVEVCLLGIVDREQDIFKVREFFLVKQDGSSAHTELDPQALGELMERLIKEGRSADVKKIRCWAHSHPGMDVFWSRTDDATCHLLAADWLISVVVTEGFRIRGRVDVATPLAFTLDQVPVFCDLPVDSGLLEQCRAEVAEKVKPSPLFEGDIIQRHRRDDKPRPRREHEGKELMDYCELCGGSHPEGECPMEEESGYELARQESGLNQGRGFFDDEQELWF